MTLISFKDQREGQQRVPVYYQSNFVGYVWMTGYERGQLKRGYSLRYEVGKGSRNTLHGEKNPTLFKQGKFAFCAIHNTVIFQKMDTRTRNDKERVRILVTKKLYDLPLSDRLYFTDRVLERKYQCPGRNQINN